MSNALAMASVTAVLKGLLDNAMINHSVSEKVGSQVSVSALAPDRIKSGENEAVRLNLFLYHVAPNPGWRNIGLPSRDQRGTRLTNSPLALDLFYLLTAYGWHDFQTEILLGYAMQVFHETPVLSRDAIRLSLTAPSPGDAGVRPPAVQALAASDLADQLELIKLTPQSLSTEDIYKLWGAFQSHYRPSVAFHASVVLIEGHCPTRSPLPVLTRGQPDPATGRDAGVKVGPSLVSPYPTLLEVTPPGRQSAIRMGEVLRCHGRHLDGDEIRVQFRHARTLETLQLSASTDATDVAFDVQIPPDPSPGPQPPQDSAQNPENWQAGVYIVSAVIQRAGQPDRLTNELPLALAPSVSVGVSVVGDEATFTATVRPPVRKSQRAVLVCADRELPAEPIQSDKSNTLRFLARVKDLPSGKQWIRMRVDGMESILVDRANGLPRFDTTQQVTI